MCHTANGPQAPHDGCVDNPEYHMMAAANQMMMAAAAAAAANNHHQLQNHRLSFDPAAMAAHEYVNQLSPLAPSISSAQSFPLPPHHHRRKPLSSTSSSTTSNSAIHSYHGSFAPSARLLHHHNSQGGNGGFIPHPNGFIPLNGGVGGGPAAGTQQSLNGVTGPLGTQNPQIRKFSSSDDPEELSDDHEYYNELDRLQRELQPLNVRRNETTV